MSQPPFASPPRAAWAVALAGLAAGLLSACACAQPGGGQPPPPPPEALAACQAVAAGKACSVKTPHGTLSGTCWAPEGKPLACRPAKPPQGAPGGATGGAPPGPPPSASSPAGTAPSR